MRLIAWLNSTVALLACQHATPAPTPIAVASPPDAQPPRAAAPRALPTLVVVDGGYGSQGPGLPGGYEDSMRVLATIDITVPPGSAPSTLRSTRVDLFGADGQLGASMRQRIDLGRVDPIPTDGALPNPFEPHPPFDGVLGPGRTRVWIHGWLSHVSHRPLTRARVTVEIGDDTVTAEGTILGGEWPTG